MNSSSTYDVIIIGGGLAGLVAATHLGRAGVKIVLIEKYEYPHHKVCGEYVSNEIMPYLRDLEIDPFSKGAVEISRFEISSRAGELVQATLPLGGFGISRYRLDAYLYENLPPSVTVVFETAEFATNQGERFMVRTQTGSTFCGDVVLGAFGKRSLMDTTLKRDFSNHRSPWLAVKAHYDYPFPSDKVALHNFDGGYCGLSRVEDEIVNACYLTNYRSFKKYGSIDNFQQELMSQNKYLRHFFSHAKPRFERPLTISQVSFSKKKSIVDGIFMIGDSAGLIHPLCGNGMAMAIHSAKIFSELFLKHNRQPDFDRKQLELTYRQQWEEAFKSRLQTGRRIQQLLLHPTASQVGMKIARRFPSIVPKIIKKTHGELLV
ncbi:MAG: NAD(P)/FAD-dependent oxidoreductase [Bacteroidota bacterium]